MKREPQEHQPGPNGVEEVFTLRGFVIHRVRYDSQTNRLTRPDDKVYIRWQPYTNSGYLSPG